MRVKSFAELESAERVTAAELRATLEDYVFSGAAIIGRTVVGIIARTELTPDDELEIRRLAEIGHSHHLARSLGKESEHAEAEQYRMVWWFLERRRDASASPLGPEDEGLFVPGQVCIAVFDNPEVSCPDWAPWAANGMLVYAARKSPGGEIEFTDRPNGPACWGINAFRELVSFDRYDVRPGFDHPAAAAQANAP